MFKNFSQKIQWVIVSSFIIVVFFVSLYVFINFGGTLNLSMGGDYYSSFTVTGESTIKNIDPNTSDTSQVIDSARSEAFDNATKIGQQLSQLSGRRLGKITSISEYVDRNPQNSDPSQTVPNPNASSSGNLKVSVTVTYQLK